MSKKEEKDYIKDGVLCSFPYHLELHKSEGAVEGEEVSYIYCDLKFNDEEKKAIEKELSDIFTAEGAGFYLKEQKSTTGSRQQGIRKRTIWIMK